MPDHRNVPGMAGDIRTQGGDGFDGIRPSGTIGSEKTMRISAASWSWAISPVGPVVRTRSVVSCSAATAADANAIAHAAAAACRGRPVRYLRALP